jgi:hypothetical protein
VAYKIQRYTNRKLKRTKRKEACKSKLIQHQHQQNSQWASQDSGISSSNSILAPENDDDKTNQQYPKTQRTHNNNDDDNKGVAKENASIVGIFPLTDSLFWVLWFRAFPAMYLFLLLLHLLVVCTKMEHNQIATKSHKDTQNN